MGLRGPGAKPKNAAALNRCVSPDSWTDPTLSRAEKVIAFVESLRVTSGLLAGEAFLLRPWQQEIIREWYAVDDQGNRLVRTGLFSVGRKNGKTGLCAALALCHLLGPECEPRGQIVVGATDSDQSGLIFDELCAFINDNSSFSEQCNVKRHEKMIEHIPSGSKFKALSSDAKKAHGLSPSVVILDELAQWGDGIGRGLYDALTTSQGARKEPLVFIIGTQAAEDSALMSQLIDHAKRVKAGEVTDPTFSGFVFEVPADADVFDKDVWPLANPALGDFRSFEDLKILSERAKRLPTLEATFRNLFCNQRVQSDASLITKQEWMRCASKEGLRDGEEIYLGLDLSARTDLTALVACSAKDGDRLKAWFWKPGDLVEEHTSRDKVPYDVWVKQEWIEAPKGTSVNYEFIARRIAKISQAYKVVGMAYDRYRMDVLISELTRIGMDCFLEKEGVVPRSGALRLKAWGQGYVDMAPAVDAFEASILEGRLNHDMNPVLTFCVANAIVTMDAAGNRKLDKSATRFRIDGAVAAAMAIGLKSKQTAKPEPKYQVVFV